MLKPQSSFQSKDKKQFKADRSNSMKKKPSETNSGRYYKEDALQNSSLPRAQRAPEGAKIDTILVPPMNPPPSHLFALPSYSGNTCNRDLRKILNLGKRKWQLVNIWTQTI